MAITPPDTPSSPENYAQVATSPADIQAPLPEGEIAAAYGAANADSGPRQAQAEQMIQSPQGFGSAGYDIDAGTTAGWPADVEPDVAGP
jgi:hypothetical protein